MSQTCTHCHATLQGNETFCRNCGTLTGVGGADPTLIIRRPRPDASSPWAKLGARFTSTVTGGSAISPPPTTIGAFVTQSTISESATPARYQFAEQGHPAPLQTQNDERDFERTRIVGKPVGQSGATLPKGWLVAIDGPERGESWTVRPGKNSIGRTLGADILLQEDSISGSHAVLWLGEDECATLVDRDSSNGTFVDRQQVFKPTEIADGALIRCGEKTTLQWVRFHPKSASQG